MKGLILLFFFILTISFLQTAFCQTTYPVGIDTLKIGHNPDVGAYADVRGFKMYYEIYGTGEPLLIIHGNGGEINNFTGQIPFFAQHYKVIVADSRDQGKSKDPSDSLSYEMMADDLNGLLEKLHMDSCYVIGWSDGGINGLLLAMRHPDKVKKLAITGANLWPDSSAVDPWVYMMAYNINDTLSKMSQTADIKHISKLIHLLVFEPHIAAKDLKKIKCPTLVIGGDHDVIRPEHTMLIAQSIPKSYLWILPDSGHSTPVVYKDQFNHVVYDFFVKPYRMIQKKDRFN